MTLTQVLLIIIMTLLLVGGVLVFVELMLGRRLNLQHDALKKQIDSAIAASAKTITTQMELLRNIIDGAGSAYDMVRKELRSVHEELEKLQKMVKNGEDLHRRVDKIEKDLDVLSRQINSEATSPR